MNVSSQMIGKMMINQYSPLVFWVAILYHRYFPTWFARARSRRQSLFEEMLRLALSSQIASKVEGRVWGAFCRRQCLDRTQMDRGTGQRVMETWTLWAPKIMGNMEMASSHLQTLAILFNPSSFRVGHFDPDPMLWRNFISDVVWIQPERFHWVTWLSSLVS